MPLMAQELPKGLSDTGIKAAFMGAAVYPGFSLGIERPYRLIEVTKTRASKTKKRIKQRFLGFSANFYHHPDFHSNFYIQGEWTRRRLYPNGVYVETIVGLGASRTFLDGPTFEVSDDGEVTQLGAAGSVYALASLGAGLGYNLQMKGSRPLNIYLRPGTMVLFPYSRDVLSRMTIQAGGIYRLDSFWKSSAKLERKNK